MPDPATPVAAPDVVERRCVDCGEPVGPQDVVPQLRMMAGHPGAIHREHANAVMREAAAEIASLREEVAELRKPPGETIGWSRETLAELMSARDQIASDRRCVSRDRCAASSVIFRNCDCMQSAVWRRTSRWPTNSPPSAPASPSWRRRCGRRERWTPGRQTRSAWCTASATAPSATAMADPDLEAFLAPLRDKPWLDVNSPPSNFVGISEAELLYRLREYRESVVAAANAQIVETIAAWLENVTQEGGLKLTPGDFDDLRRGWLDPSPEVCGDDPWDVGFRAAAAAIRSGAPERWAAEREGSR